MTLLRTRGLRHSRLQCCDFALDAGAVASVTGASGNGKTQLLRALADLDPAEGDVFLEEESRAYIAAPAWRRQVAFVAAAPAWWAATVREHFEVAELARAERYLQAADLSVDALDWPVERLSTGETQRLGLVRALARSPRVLLLDEPTSGLDEASRRSVESLLESLLDEGVGIVVVAHQRGRLDELARVHLRVGRGGVVTEAAA